MVLSSGTTEATQPTPIGRSVKDGYSGTVQQNSKHSGEEKKE
jgi:hypothetical protein